MRHSISTIITVTGLAIFATAPAIAFAESFECDLERNQLQVSVKTYSGRGHFQQQSTLTAAFDERVLAMGLPMIRKMVGVESQLSSEYNENNVRVCAVY